MQREELRRGKVLRTSREEGRGESCEDLCRVPEWHLQAVSPGGGILSGERVLVPEELDLAPPEVSVSWE